MIKKKLDRSFFKERKFIVFVALDEDLFLAWKSIFSDLLKNEFVVVWSPSLTQLPTKFNIAGAIVLSWLGIYSTEIDTCAFQVPFLIYLQSSEFDKLPKKRVSETLKIGKINSKNLYDTVRRYV